MVEDSIRQDTVVTLMLDDENLVEQFQIQDPSGNTERFPTYLAK